MAKVHIVEAGEINGGQRKKRVRRPQKPTLAGALRAARKAGVSVAGATMGVDGSLSLTFGAPTEGNGGNPWDVVIRHDPDQKRPS
jgi:hypothetical protein